MCLYIIYLDIASGLLWKNNKGKFKNILKVMYYQAANSVKGVFYLNVNSKLLKCHKVICLFIIFEIFIISTPTTKNSLFNP